MGNLQIANLGIGSIVNCFYVRRENHTAQPQRCKPGKEQIQIHQGENAGVPGGDCDHHYRRQPHARLPQLERPAEGTRNCAQLPGRDKTGLAKRAPAQRLPQNAPTGLRGYR